MERVAGFVDALVRAIEDRWACPPGEPERKKVHEDLEARLRSCHDQFGDLAIGVDDRDLLFDGTPVYSSPKRDGSLPHTLFQDGVREIILRRGLDAAELRAFVDVMRRATDPRGRGWDDSVTLLWEQGFQHIDIACLPSEEWDPEPNPGSDGGAGGEAVDRILWPGEAGPEEETDSTLDGTTDERADDWSLRTGAGPVPGEAIGAQYELSDIEAGNLRMLAVLEEALPPETQLVEVVFGLLAAEDNPAEYLEMASIVGQVIERAVMEGDPKRANQLVDRLRGISTARSTASREIQAAADQILRDIGRPEYLDQLGSSLKAHPDVDLEALSAFLVQLGPSAAPALCDLLGQVEERSIRRAICEALAVSCRSNVNILIERLSDSRWYLVRNILYILGRMAHQGVERALGEALYHEDVRVRIEAVSALGEVDSPTGRAYLNSALRDPEKRVRMLVARVISKRGGSRAAEVLWGVIESPEFRNRDAEERTAFFAALGQTDSHSIVPRLERILTGGGPLRLGNEESLGDAARALAWLGTPPALSILRRELTSRRGSVRRVVEEALGELQKIRPENQGAGGR